MGVDTYLLAESFAQQVGHFAQQHLFVGHGGLSFEDVVFLYGKDVLSIVLRCGATDAGCYLISGNRAQTEYIFDDGALMVVSSHTGTVGRTRDVAQVIRIGERSG